MLCNLQKLNGVNNGGSGGGSDVEKDYHFPKGYVLKSETLGDSFPGYGANVIPIVVKANVIGRWAWRYQAGGETRGDRFVSLNGKDFMKMDAGSTNGNNYISGTVSCDVIFLPELYGYDFEALKNACATGVPITGRSSYGPTQIVQVKVMAWLERG